MTTRRTLLAAGAGLLAAPAVHAQGEWPNRNVRVMRNGETIVTKDVKDSNIEEVISTMVGRNANELFPERGTATDEIALTVEGLNGRRVKDVSFTARKGEVLGIGVRPKIGPGEVRPFPGLLPASA